MNIRGFRVILLFKDNGGGRPHVSSSLFVFPTYKLFKMSCCDFESCRQTYGRLTSDFRLDLNSLTHDSSNFKYTNEISLFAARSFFPSPLFFSLSALLFPIRAFFPYPLFFPPPTHIALIPILCKYKKFLQN